MVILSAKVSKQKILTGILVAAAVIILLVVLLKRSEKPAAENPPQTQTMEAGSNEDRISFLSSFGWKVSDVPVETQEVRIPETFNEVFTRYNQLQQSQSFDLSEYSGKTVKRYVYAISNHPDGSPDHYATLLVYRGKVIGGDVSSTAQGGKMHGFQMPAAAQ